MLLLFWAHVREAAVCQPFPLFSITVPDKYAYFIYKKENSPRNMELNTVDRNKLRANLLPFIAIFIVLFSLELWQQSL